MKKFYERYKHAIPLICYGIVYMTWFSLLESKVKRPEYLIHMKLDDSIPFCEYFVIPYFLWFLYVAIVVLYLFFKNKQDYYRSCVFLFTGMTIFLIVSTFWPNGHHLRPAVLPRKNVFSDLVAFLYRTDTPTNLWPSIHVFNSLGAHFAVVKNEQLSKKLPVKVGSLVLCISIILSTMFLKQHSVFDVLTGITMALVLYVVVYGIDIVSVYQERKYTARGHRIRQV